MFFVLTKTFPSIIVSDDSSERFENTDPFQLQTVYNDDAGLLGVCECTYKIMGSVRNKNIHQYETIGR